MRKKKKENLFKRAFEPIGEHLEEGICIMILLIGGALQWPALWQIKVGTLRSYLICEDK